MRTFSAVALFVCTLLAASSAAAQDRARREWDAMSAHAAFDEFLRTRQDEDDGGRADAD